jgi:hypothetical protein
MLHMWMSLATAGLPWSAIIVGVAGSDVEAHGGV